MPFERSLESQRHKLYHWYLNTGLLYYKSSALSTSEEKYQGLYGIHLSVCNLDINTEFHYIIHQYMWKWMVLLVFNIFQFGLNTSTKCFHFFKNKCCIEAWWCVPFNTMHTAAEIHGLQSVHGQTHGYDLFQVSQVYIMRPFIKQGKERIWRERVRSGTMKKGKENKETCILKLPFEY